MFVANLSSALPTLSCATAQGVLSRARGVQWAVTIWCLLFTVSTFSAIHLPDGQAADDALEAIEAVADDVLGEVLSVAKLSKGSERAIKVALGETVKQLGQYFSVEYWAAHTSDAPDASPTSAVAPDHPSDAPELWLPPFPMVLTPGLRVAHVRVAFPPFQAGPTSAPTPRPPARA